MVPVQQQQTQQQQTQQQQTQQQQSQQQQSQQQQQRQPVSEYQTCWQGTLQWVEKIENPTNINEIPCQISMHPEDKQDWNADTWPQKLIMQLVPKQLMAVIDGFVLYNSNPLHFHPQNCKALESVVKIMRYGFAGCVYFKSISPEAESDLKYVILLYISDQHEFVGFIPKNQTTLLDNLSRALKQKMPSLILRNHSQELVLVKRHTQQQEQEQQQQQQQPQQQQQQQQQQPEEEHQTLWEGLLEWIDRTQSLNDADQVIRHIPCRISIKPKDGAPDLKADSWPQKLIVQLVPKELLGVVGGIFLKNSNPLHFHPENCEALELLTGALSSGYAGYVHFKRMTPTSECDVKAVVLIYVSLRNEYVALFPNDDPAYMAGVHSTIMASGPSQAELIDLQKTAEWNAMQLSKALGSSSPVRNIQRNSLLAHFSGLPQPPTVHRTGSPRSQSPEQDQQILLAQQQQSQQEQQQQGPGGTIQDCQAAGGPGPQQPPIDNMEVGQQETLLESQLRGEEMKTELEEEMQEKSQLEELEREQQEQLEAQLREMSLQQQSEVTPPALQQREQQEQLEAQLREMSLQQQSEVTPPALQQREQQEQLEAQLREMSLQQQSEVTPPALQQDEKSSWHHVF
ncbi:mediator of RNA polymerase II transcription subunit 25-like [Schistocerca nitens]|uniref:mediator of RNA polymerase II transcription subunit 25-like n=1 Tax=Schistocerca nitens TaxID=7011 RepID=UPI002117C795|nr:mediator of RNA polymerase II transcription subunit 25-like [Schistocerca nitens]XP_049792052.1 mediator of RNA polymerase II transcription subunit 25-like [Schistocerca nitens]XP_049792053.1 mediator of RNA polymerase II transcription subunit 25-like [Schistocerca nitens]XP_049792054.1 mediator of RNA polymerase II transcription subunit 25-like [Schistocerca nitens]XP_049792055.1 mediator of RNA polymerase II transcription subunit 25-like [Schistocerca nitens]